MNSINLEINDCLGDAIEEMTTPFHERVGYQCRMDTGRVFGSTLGTQHLILGPLLGAIQEELRVLDVE